MRNKFFMALVTTVVATGVVAANATTAVAAQTPTNVVMPNAMAPNASAFVAPSMGTNLSTTVQAVSTEKSKYSASYVAENGVGVSDANRNKYEEIYSIQHIGLGYALGNDKKIQYRQYFHYNMTDRARTDEWGLGDHVFQYTDATALKIADADMLFYARLYMPGAEWTREVGQYELRLFESVTQSVSSKTSLEYSLGTRLYAHSGNNDGQTGLRLLPAVELSYKANKYIKPYASVFMSHTWNHSGSGPAMYWNAGEVSNPENYVETLYTDVGTGVTINKNVDLTVNILTKKNTKSNVDYKPFHQDFSYYELALSVSM